MIQFTLFSNQPAEQGRAVHVAPWAVDDVTEAEYKRRVNWFPSVWVPVAVIEMVTGEQYVVEDFDRSARVRIEAGKREERANERATGFVE